jgi:hypothetical protein
MTTCQGQHQLIAIRTDEQGAGIAEIIRWCQECGAITIDIDADGRTSPGAVMAMRLPRTEADRQGRA